MKRNYQTDTTYVINDQDLLRQTTFHEAGHAAAICLYNKQKQLPPVHFQITIKPLNQHNGNPLGLQVYERCAALVEAR